MTVLSQFNTKPFNACLQPASARPDCTYMYKAAMKNCGNLLLQVDGTAGTIYKTAGDH